MSRLVRAAVRPAALLAALFGLLLVASVPASAGGPTSVLISSPSTQSTASLYATEADYELLFDALGGEHPEADPAKFTDWVPGPGGTQVNVTWLRHDVHVWRVDRIVTEDDGEVWVHTTGSLNEPFDHTDESGVWHRSPKPEELRDLLDRLGVTWSGSTVSASTPSAPPAEVESVDQSNAPADNRLAGTPPSTTSPWAWVVPGVLVGALLGVAADRRRRG